MNRQRDGDDRRAILAAIEEMASAYFAKDFERWSRLWVHEPYTTRWYWFRNGGLTVREGWELQASLMQEAMVRHPAANPSTPQARRENINIRISGDLAWATFDQVAPRTGETFDVPGLQKELRIFERHEGRWLVAFHGAIQRTPDDGVSPLVGVAGDGTISWISPAASRALETSRSFLVRYGRLRGRTRGADQSLRAAITWAERLGNTVSPGATRIPFVSQRGALPVVLQDADGAIEICWVLAEGGQITVAINDQTRVERALDAAALIFSLSGAQTRLAREIVLGAAVVDAADSLGISPATARTHLQRMYDKTGVRSQPALVRTLVSVAPPTF